MLKYIFTRRHNLFDVFVVVVTVNMLIDALWLAAAAAIIVGSGISVYFERKIECSK